jgi:hypothetical protein
MANELMVGNVASLAEIEAAQIDQQIATAKRYPRDEDASVGKAIKLATYNPKIAQGCIYMRPTGKKDRIMSFAEGPSIRLAECLKSSWGNLRLGTRVVGEKDGNIHVQAVCHDLESNVYETSEVAKSITRSGGGRYSDTMIQNVIGAASKIALRNVIFSVIPKAFAEQIMDECRKTIVGEGEDKAALYSAIVSSFADMGIDEARMLSVVDRQDYPAGSDGELVFLIGLNNAIKDGICTCEDVFGSANAKPFVAMPQEKKPEAAPAKKTAPASKTRPVEAPREMTIHERFLSNIADIAAAKGKENEIDAICTAEWSMTAAEMPVEMHKAVLEHFKAL